MSILHEDRISDSPYVDLVTRGRMVGNGASIRPAENRWHLVFVSHPGGMSTFYVGPWTTAGVVSYAGGAEVLWIRFKLGTFMPHLPIRKFVDRETALPLAAGRSFWLKGSAWQFPDFENVETFVEQLARDELLVRDPAVGEMLQGHPQEISPRTARHRFLQATGMSHSHIQQVERAQQAAELLAGGLPILETTFEAGYYDQPHLTRSLKRWVGLTPAQLLQGQPQQES